MFGDARSEHHCDGKLWTVTDHSHGAAGGHSHGGPEDAFINSMIGLALVAGFVLRKLLVDQFTHRHSGRTGHR